MAAFRDRSLAENAFVGVLRSRTRPAIPPRVYVVGLPPETSVARLTLTLRLADPEAASVRNMQTHQFARLALVPVDQRVEQPLMLTRLPSSAPLEPRGVDGAQPALTTQVGDQSAQACTARQGSAGGAAASQPQPRAASARQAPE